MSAALDRPTWFTRGVLPGAFLLALASLIAAIAGGEELADVVFDGYLVAVAALALAVFGPFALLLCAMRSPDRAMRLRREALTLPCMLAPLAVLAPWMVAPTHFGPGLAGPPFFFGWLTRYPNFGPVNYEVLLGIGAVLGASAMPAFFATYATLARRLHPGVVMLFAALQLVAYVPVLLYLDVSFAPWMSGSADAFSAIVIGSGALLRALATAMMIAAIPLSLRAKSAPAVIWETS